MLFYLPIVYPWGVYNKIQVGMLLSPLGIMRNLRWGTHDQYVTSKSNDPSYFGNCISRKQKQSSFYYFLYEINTNFHCLVANTHTFIALKHPN